MNDMMREKIVAGNIYHVLNRGVDRRKIFEEEKDNLRFVHDLFEFNDEAPTPNINYVFRAENKSLEVGLPKIIRRREPRKLLVDVLAFALMPNHYHLLLRPRTDEGVTKFMRKLNTGYTNYFNVKYKRNGVLFQGKYKSISVTNDAHMIHLPYYIHCNPLDLKTPEWRYRELENKNKTLDFLNKYRWSSHLDYCGIKNFPSVTQRDFLLKFFGGTDGYRKSMAGWLDNFDEKAIKDIALE